MIYIDYQGRLGNNMFQYAFARILANENDMVVGTPFVQNDIVSVKDSASSSTSNPMIRIDEDLNNPTWNIQSLSKDSSYLLHGFFQRWYLYEHRVDFVKSIFTYDDVVVDNFDDACIHIRLTDYRLCGNVLKSSDVYLSVLDKLKFGKLYIVTDDPNDPYLNAFKQKYDCVVVGESPRSDFYFMMRFNTIIISNSTFSWWAAFLSKAQNKYIPKDFVFKNVVDLHKIGIEY